MTDEMREQARSIVAEHYDYKVVENVSLHCAEVEFVLKGMRAITTPKAPCPVTDEMLYAALHARVPGGAEVWNFLPQKDAFTPHDTAWDVMRAAFEAAMHRAAPVGDGDEK